MMNKISLVMNSSGSSVVRVRINFKMLPTIKPDYIYYMKSRHLFTHCEMNRFLVSSLSLLLFVLAGCNRTSRKEGNLKPEEFPVVEVFAKDINVPLEYVTSIQAFQNVEIRARVEGYLEDIFVDE